MTDQLEDQVCRVLLDLSKNNWNSFLLVCSLIKQDDPKEFAKWLERDIKSREH